MLLRRLLLSAALMGLGTVAARPAAACQPAPCWAATVTPGPGATVPANVPALGFSLASIRSQAVGEANELRMFDSDGQPMELTYLEIAAGATSYFVKPREPFQPNRTYTLRYLQRCSDGEPRLEPLAVERPLMVGPATPLPTSIGTAVVTGHSVVVANVGDEGCYRGPLRAGLTRVEVHPSKEFGAYLPLGGITASINGASAPALIYPWGGPGEPIELDVYAHCAGDAGRSAGLPPGTYQLELGAYLFGVTPLPPPLTIAVTLSCEERPITSGADAGGAIGGDATVSTDAGGTLAGAVGCGCRVAGASGPGAPAALLVLVAFALLRRRDPRDWPRRQTGG